jgi:hypothetical protein
MAESVNPRPDFSVELAWVDPLNFRALDLNRKNFSGGPDI